MGAILSAPVASLSLWLARRCADEESVDAFSSLLFSSLRERAPFLPDLDLVSQRFSLTLVQTMRREETAPSASAPRSGTDRTAIVCQLAARRIHLSNKPDMLFVLTVCVCMCLYVVHMWTLGRREDTLRRLFSLPFSRLFLSSFLLVSFCFFSIRTHATLYPGAVRLHEEGHRYK